MSLGAAKESESRSLGPDGAETSRLMSPPRPEQATAAELTALDVPAPCIYDVPPSALLPADSPRLTGEDEDHARVLAATEATLPPILVHRPTMRVIDGMHRLHAAILLGSKTVRVRYFEGSTDDAFVLAVRANIGHGKPLTLAEREAASTRILVSHPEWSDRSIADACGLSSKTVGAIRRATTGMARPAARIGRDGRVRPLDTSQSRQHAAELLAKHPEASLRQVAQATGISPATVRDVRARFRRR
jgi:ParB-like chromosome segregation protein Spo0J